MHATEVKLLKVLLHFFHRKKKVLATNNVEVSRSPSKLIVERCNVIVNFREDVEDVKEMCTRLFFWPC